MDILVVADPRDAFAGLFANEVRRRGKRPVVLRRNDAARFFTITTDANGARVEPSVPVLLRAPAPSGPNGGPDDAFPTGEGAATLWTACALTTAPVVNRPARADLEARDAGDTPHGAHLVEGEIYERVLVLRGQAWRSAAVDLAEFDLERRSVDIVAAHGLVIAAVTWGVDMTRRVVRLARVNPLPQADQILPVWNQCLPPLLEYLQC